MQLPSERSDGCCWRSRFERVKRLAETLSRTAVWSKCRAYRFQLVIRWQAEGPLANWVMLNPSTADEYQNDPTVERVERRCREAGFGGVIVTNIFGYRSTAPQRLYEQDDPVGRANNRWIVRSAEQAVEVVCAWGTHGAHLGRGEQVRRLLASRGIPLKVLHLTASGEPVHPLYQPYTRLPRVWEE